MTLIQLKYIIAIAEEKSINEAAKKLFVAQPSLSAAVKDIEGETGITIFRRSSRGVDVTQEGEEFIGYARQVMEQYSLLEQKYVYKETVRKKFGVSTQHYTFAVKAFVELVKCYGMSEYEFAIRETKTHEIIEDVRSFRSEIGILYVNDFNRKILMRIFEENGLEFNPIMKWHVYVYMWKGHPLAGKKEIDMKELENYPCLSFEQGNSNSFYFSEEVLSTYGYKQLIKANDRATLLNLMVGLNGYTMCSGIICEELNGNEYCAVRLKSDEIMTIGYLVKKGVTLSSLGRMYVEELFSYRDKTLG